MKKGSSEKRSSGKKREPEEQVVSVETIIVNENDELSEAKQKILTQFLGDTDRIWQAHA